MDFLNEGKVKEDHSFYTIASGLHSSLVLLYLRDCLLPENYNECGKAFIEENLP